MENTIIATPEVKTLGDAVSFCSLKANSQAEKAVLFRAMANPDHRLADFIGKTILAKDIYVETVEMMNEQTGAFVKTPRTVIIDKDGVSYHCVSFGIFNSIKRIFAVFGEPTWAEPLPLTVKQVGNGTRKVLTLDVNF